MKKQFGLPLMLASALAFSACSSDDVADNGNGSLTDFSNGGYVKLAINLPTVKDAGAFKAPNDKFDDGLPGEYEVKNASVILFQGNNENDAQFHSAYTLPTTVTSSTKEQITKVLQLTKPVKGELIGDNLYALVILNNNGLITVGGDHKLTIGTTDFAGTFKEFKKETATSSTYNVNQFVSTDGGFFMSNAPLANKPGGTDDPSSAGINTLVKLNGKTYETSELAEATPAADIYVERGVAKVTFTNDKDTPTEFQDANHIKTPLSDGAGIADVKYTITGWGLDITNKSSYLVRHYSSAWNGLKTDDTSVTNNYRFIGSKVVEDRKTPLQYRTYWAEDPNYDSYKPLKDEFSIRPDGEPDAATISDKFFTTTESNPQYCFENTFDVANQNQDKTTRVIVRAQVTVGGTAADFYMINNGKSTLYSEANLKALVQNAIYNDPQVQHLLTTISGATLDEGKINVKFTDNVTTAVRTITGFSFTINGTDYSEASTDLNNVLTNARNKVSNIIKYTKGIVYYPVRIKHFGNDLTPWNKDQTGVTKSEIYAGDNADRYLGRYGVVRNNWYDLGVNSISGIGSAVVPPHTSTPDDELDQYISVRINVLSWAKRTQREDL